MVPTLRRLLALGCLAWPLALQAQAPALARTFNNPSPAIGDSFGAGTAALDKHRVLISAPRDDLGGTNAGVVHLIHTNGTLLTTITNPHPAWVSIFGFNDSDEFGAALAAVAGDRIVIGAPYEDYKGAAYFFTTNGTLLTTFTNPSIGPSLFGVALAALGNDRVFIGASDFTTDPDLGTQVGEAYLFHTNGTLLTTFYNPNPEIYDQFGFSLAVVGTDRVLIGSRGVAPGKAFLFDTNGALRMTFTNPTPQLNDLFGHTVAAIGLDRVAIGAPGKNAGATESGAAYVFHTNGTLLATITNPTPAVGDVFGYRLGVLGGGRLLITAPRDDTGAVNAGTAYLFNASGALLAPLANPAPTASDHYGYHLAAFGGDQVLIGAPDDSAGATYSGTAYLLRVPLYDLPVLTIRPVAPGTVAVSWPALWDHLALEQNLGGMGAPAWNDVSNLIVNEGTNKTLTINTTNQSGYYRLIAP